MEDLAVPNPNINKGLLLVFQKFAGVSEAFSSWVKMFILSSRSILPAMPGSVMGSDVPDTQLC